MDVSAIRLNVLMFLICLLQFKSNVPLVNVVGMALVHQNFDFVLPATALSIIPTSVRMVHVPLPHQHVPYPMVVLSISLYSVQLDLVLLLP